jgi:hypothetical protein
MVFTMAMQVRGGPGWTRRAVLAAAGSTLAGTASGCSWPGSDPPPPPPPPDPLEPLLAGTRALADRSPRVLAGHPGLAGRLSPLHRAHREHETALLAVIARPGLASPSPGSGTWHPPRASRPVPTDPVDAVAELRAAEQQARTEAARACLSAPPGRAALLGSITAARATHAEVLSE